MTGNLKKAFDAASRLPAGEQDRLAAAIFQELAAEERWHATLSATRSQLERLAEEALEEHRRGATKVLDPDGL